MSFLSSRSLSALEQALSSLWMFYRAAEIDFVYTVCQVSLDRYGALMQVDEIVVAQSGNVPLHVNLLGVQNSGMTQAAGLDNGPPIQLKLFLTSAEVEGEGDARIVTCNAHPHLLERHGGPFRSQHDPSIVFRFTWAPFKKEGTLIYVPIRST